MKLHFLGPVCYYDMIRAARRGRYFFLRCLYALGLVCILCLMYGEIHDLSTTRVSPQELTRFAENFFNLFMVVQFFLALMLTPAYVAGAISEEKERKTLEFILATDLQGQEIVLSKLVSRLANLTLFLLAGLPVLSLIQLFGGVSPKLLWCGFGATAMAVLSTACISILISVYVRRVRDAVVRSTMVVFAYYVTGLLLLWLYMIVQGGEVLGGKLNYDTMTLFQQGFAWVFQGFMSGHAIYVVFTLFERADPSGLGIGLTAPELLRNFAIFHGIVALVCLTWACLRVRSVFIRQNYGTPLKTPIDAKGRFRRRPAIGERPILWKERFVESAARMTKGAVFFLVMCALLALAPLAFIAYYGLLGPRSDRLSYDDFRGAISIYVRVAGPVVASLLLLGIGVRAASTVASERDRQTLDSLLASPLTLTEIRYGKWIGAILGAKWLFFLLLFIWGVGLLTGGMHILAFPVVLFALSCYAALMASLGLFFSVSAKSTNRAMLWTVGLAIFFGGGHWLTCGFPAMAMTQGNEYVGYFFAGLTPPFVFGLFAFSYENISHDISNDRIAAMIAFCIVGLVVSGIAALVLWGAAAQRFLSSSGRIPPGYWPRRSPVARTPDDA